MKSREYKERFYRSWQASCGLQRQEFCLGESDLLVLCEKVVERPFVLERLKFYRSQIEEYIKKRNEFLTSLVPLECEEGARPIIKDMISAAKKAGVGPMAGVAGAVAKFLGQDLLDGGYSDVVIENGGDIFLKVTRAVMVGVYTGNSKFSSDLRLKIHPQDTPLGICTSSGTIGHSLSFGRADSAVILSADATLADTAATASCNLVQDKGDLPKAVEFVRSIEGLSGAVFIINNDMACWGQVEFE